MSTAKSLPSDMLPSYQVSYLRHLSSSKRQREMNSVDPDLRKVAGHSRMHAAARHEFERNLGTQARGRPALFRDGSKQHSVAFDDECNDSDCHKSIDIEGPTFDPLKNLTSPPPSPDEDREPHPSNFDSLEDTEAYDCPECALALARDAKYESLAPLTLFKVRVTSISVDEVF